MSGNGHKAGEANLCGRWGNPSVKNERHFRHTRNTKLMGGTDYFYLNIHIGGITLKLICRKLQKSALHDCAAERQNYTWTVFGGVDNEAAENKGK